MANIHVVGSCNMDLVMQLPNLPGPGNTVTGGILHQLLGGKGANQAVAAARSGASVVMHGAVGKDAFGAAVTQGLIGDGIECTFIQNNHGMATGTAVILVDQRGENLIGVASGANRNVKPPSKLHLIDAGAVLLQSEIPIEVIMTTMEAASKAHVPIIFNNAPAMGVPPEALASVHVLIVNEHEAALMTGLTVHDRPSAMQAANTLRASGVRCVIVTLGPAGCAVSSVDTVFDLPSFVVDTVDTTAAGDTFCGAFTARFVAGDTLAEATVYASAAAALSTTILGAQPSVPTEVAVRAFLASAPTQRP